MLQVIISPAKQMRAAQDTFEPQGIPPFPRETKRLHNALLDIERIEGADGLQNLWGVSDRLLVSCLDVLHAFAPVTDADTLRIPNIARHVSPAIMSYRGIQYQSMAPTVMQTSELRWLESHLWILSGLYGCVRPFDAVMPYRLEMGAKLAIDDKRDLYAFWGDRLARTIASNGNATTVVNLASVEYARAVLPHIGPKRALSPASLVKSRVMASLSNEQAPARKHADPWFAGWQSMPSKTPVSFPLSTSATAIHQSFQAKTPWSFLIKPRLFRRAFSPSTG